MKKFFTQSIPNAFKWLWRNKRTRVWLSVFVSVQIFIFVLTMVVFNISVPDFTNPNVDERVRVNLANTIDIALGMEPRTVLRRGDPVPFSRHRVINDFIESDNRRETHGFRQFTPSQDITSKEIAYYEGNRFAQEVVGEGMVLLTNHNNTLPLTNTNPRVSIFGRNSLDIVVGGSGSSGGDGGGGEVLLYGFQDAGFAINTQLRDFYRTSTSRADPPGMGERPPGFATAEVNPTAFTSAVRNSYANFSDAAIVVISRISGEGYDLPRTMASDWSLNSAIAGGSHPHDHYLQLCGNERALISYLTDLRDTGVFDSVIVLLNFSTTFEAGFITAELGDPEYLGRIDAALWMGSPGNEGGRVVARVINGEINPSGRLFGTFARNFLRNPALQNFANNTVSYTPAFDAVGEVRHHAYEWGHRLLAEGVTQTGNYPPGPDFYIVEYQEGIYVGYRYYETRAFEELLRGNANWHQNNVVFPFGYGHSYTNFSWEIEGVYQGRQSQLNDDRRLPNSSRMDSSSNTPFDMVAPVQRADGTVDDTVIQVVVNVRNTGNRAGKDVVQLYFSPTYRRGQVIDGIEKSIVNLGGFAKTGLLRPGEVEQVVLTVEAFYMASYCMGPPEFTHAWGFAQDDYGRPLLPDGGFVLEGDSIHGPAVYLFVARDAHTAWRNPLNEYGWFPNVSLVDGTMTLAFSLEESITYTTDPVTGTPIHNRFTDRVNIQLTDADGRPLTNPDGSPRMFSSVDNPSQYAISGMMPARGRRYMSRFNFYATFPTTPTLADRGYSLQIRHTLNSNSIAFTIDDETPLRYGQTHAPWYNLWENHFWNTQGTAAPTSGAWQRDGARLYHLVRPDGFPNPQRNAHGRYTFNDLRNDVHGAIEVDFYDPIFQQILDQMTIREKAELIETGAFATMQIPHIGKPRTTDPDGPSGWTVFMAGGDNAPVYGTVFYPTGPTFAATFNVDLAFDFGVMIGIEGIFGDVRGDGRPYSGWYAPGMNIHRTPFSGRNSEYYSECPFLSGMIGAHTVLGARTKGVNTYIKHFAVNDQETERSKNGLVTWLHEQAMREIYLRPFEMAVKIGGSRAMMSSFNRVGLVWAGGSYTLMTEVLRYEWGFRGTVITDFNMYRFMNVDQMIRAGGDLNLSQGGPDSIPSISSDDLTPTQRERLRAATHSILYTTVNSNAMNGWGDGVVWGERLPLWRSLLIQFNVYLFVAFLIWGFLIIFFLVRRERRLAHQGGEQDADSNNESSIE